jgi:hypothetical protein
MRSERQSHHRLGMPRSGQGRSKRVLRSGLALAATLPTAVFGVLSPVGTTQARAATAVTPVIAGAPPGMSAPIVVNNGAGDQLNPRIDGTLVAYTDYGTATPQIRYHDLTTGSTPCSPTAAPPTSSRPSAARRSPWIRGRPGAAGPDRGDAHGQGPGPHGRSGCFAKDRFAIDLAATTVTCPNDVTVALRPLPDGGGHASFGKHCAGCPLRSACTTAKGGRVISVSAYEAELERARAIQADPGWKARYRATRPKVERKQAHMMRRRHGGRRARMRGRARIAQDFKLLAGACNLARLAVLGVASTAAGWAVATN